MGVSYIASLIVGVRVPIEEFEGVLNLKVKDYHRGKKVKKQRGCNHRETKDNFCGECGAIMWKVPPQEHFSIHDLVLNDFIKHIDGKHVIIGKKIAKIDLDYPEAAVSFQDIGKTVAEVREEINEFMTDYEIPEKLFGMHFIGEAG